LLFCAELRFGGNVVLLCYWLKYQRRGGSMELKTIACKCFYGKPFKDILRPNQQIKGREI
jgi:hypothetical protein